MHTRFLLFFCALPAFAAITNLRQIGSTPTAIILGYTAPALTACVPEVSESPSYSPLLHDVDSTLFAGSNSDFRNGAQGRERIFIIGNAGTGIEYAPVGSDGARYSRALQTNTPHYIRLTCGADVATITARTSNIAPGDTRARTTAPIDPASPGLTAWPKLPYDTTTGVIDPVSGVWLQRMWMPNANQVSQQGIYSLAYAYDEAGTWTNVANLLPRTVTDESVTPSGSPFEATVSGAANYAGNVRVRRASDNALMTQVFDLPSVVAGTYYSWGNGTYRFNVADSTARLITYKTAANDGTVASFTGSSNDPIKVLYAGPNNGNGPTTGLTLYVKGYVDNASTTLEACVTFNGHSCYGPYIALPAMPVGSLGATVSAGDLNVWTNNVPVPAMIGAWLSPNQEIPGFRFTQAGGYGTNTGSALASTFVSGGGGVFGTDWGANTHIIYNGVDYKGPTVLTSTSLTLPSAPANATNATWTAPTFGFLLRKSSVGGTVNLDYVGFTPSFYYDQVPNGGSGGLKQCTTSRYHSGWRIGGPQGVNTNAATNTTPIVIRTTIPFTDLVTGDVVKIRDVPGNTAANGTWTITVTGAQTFSLNGSVGNGNFPSDVGDTVYYGGGGLVWKLTSPTGHLCYVSGNGGDIQLYWINPDSTPADIRYQGPGWTVFQGQQSAVHGIFAENDPEVPSQYSVIVNGSGKQELIRGVYTGSIIGGMFQPVGLNISTLSRDTFAIWNFTSLTPAPSTLTDRWQAFDPAIGSIQPALIKAPKACILAFSATLNIQNSMGWLATYDVCANAVAGMMNTWQHPNSRYCGLHTPFAWEGADYYLYQTYQLNGVDGTNGPTAYKGPYRMPLTSGAISGTATDCATQFTSLGIANTLNITGSQCTTISVGTLTPITPATATPANDTLGGQTLQLGDHLVHYDGVNGGGDQTYGNNQEFENMKVVGISGLNLIVQRAQSDGGIATSHPSGGYMHVACSSQNRGWDYTNAPHGSTGTDPYSQNQSGVIIDLPLSAGSHTFTRQALTVIDVSGGPAGFTCPSFGPFSNVYTTRNYPWPNHFLAPASAYGCVAGEPGFDGIFGRGSGNDHEKHPSPVDNILANPSFFDSRPFEYNTQWEQTVSKVGTYVYKVTAYNGPYTFDEKRSVLAIKVGHHTVMDVSGPGVILADTVGAHYTYCLTHIAGECRSGSAVGDVYVNAPFVGLTPAGVTYNPGQYKCALEGTSWAGMEDICVTLQPSYMNTTMQYSADNDPFNTGARRITSSFHNMGSFGHIETSPALPDGGWTINQSITNDGLNNLFLAKIPPYPGAQRGVNRASWIPVPIRFGSVPAGTASAYLRFGYNPAMECTTRREKCVSNAATIQTGGNVFKWETADAPAGLSCASGCTITIPAFSQRVIWTQAVFLNGSGAIIKTGPVEVSVTP